MWLLRRAARGYVREGLPLKQALVSAGYSSKQAKKGVAVVARSAPLRKAFIQEMNRWEELGECLPGPQGRARYIRSKLMWHSLHGEQRRGQLRALDLMAKDKQVDLYSPDTVVGIAALEVPTEWRERDSLPAAGSQAEGNEEQEEVKENSQGQDTVD